jgi:hypothetical protein
MNEPGDRYPERDVVGLVWRSRDNLSVTYSDGQTTSVIASPGVAVEVAKSAGLILVTGPEDGDGILRWERPQGT